jgi:hypothetical protein
MDKLEVMEEIGDMDGNEIIAILKL